MNKTGDEKNMFYTGFYTPKAYKMFSEALSSLQYLQSDFASISKTMNFPDWLSLPYVYVDAETKEIVLTLSCVNLPKSAKTGYLQALLEFACRLKSSKKTSRGYIDVKCSFKSMSLLHYALSGKFLKKHPLPDEEIKALKGIPNNPIQSAYIINLLEEIENQGLQHAEETASLKSAIDADIDTALNQVKDKWKKIISEKQKQSDESIADLFSKVKELLPGFLDNKTIKASRSILRQLISASAETKYRYNRSLRVSI